MEKKRKKKNQKKNSKKGFTLIELLAVITIMGILMMAAIPAVSRTIENARRDTYGSISKTYLDAVRNAVLADNLTCFDDKTPTASSTTTTVSGQPDGDYYFPICTNKNKCVSDTDTTVGIGTFTSDQIATSTSDLMESAARSSFGAADLRGYVYFKKNGQKTTYKILLVDTGQHGFKQEKTEEQLSERSTVQTKNQTVASIAKASYKPCKFK